jgi:hypothetical protein
MHGGTWQPAWRNSLLKFSERKSVSNGRRVAAQGEEVLREFQASVFQQRKHSPHQVEILTPALDGLRSMYGKWFSPLVARE